MKDKTKMKPGAASDIFSVGGGDNIKDVILNNKNDYETKYSCYIYYLNHFSWGGGGHCPLSPIPPWSYAWLWVIKGSNLMEYEYILFL